MIKVSLSELKRYLLFLLEETKDSLQSKTPDNAFFHSDLGRKQAIMDILNLIDLYNEEFYNHIPEVRAKRFQNKNPEYDDALDLANEDKWWMVGYNSIIEKISGK